MSTSSQSSKPQNPFERIFGKQSTEQQAAPEQTVISTISIDASVAERIAKYKSISTNGQKRPVSKRLVLGNKTDIQAAVCDSTGIVYGILMPAVAGHAFLVESPFASYKNCRGMAFKGRHYLASLDSQILAGMLITLAENYSLFRFQPADSGAQKNAILRTADREVLIDTILLIEAYVNSNNAFYIPKLSLILTPELMMGGINVRMREWLRTTVDAIYRPDTETYEETTAVKRSSPTSKQLVSNVRKEAIAARKEFKEWKKEAKTDIAALFTAKKISFKLKTYLLAVLTEENIAAADLEVINLLASKLDSLNDATASDIADQIKYFHSKLSVKDELEESNFSDMPVGVYADSEPVEPIESVEKEAEESIETEASAEPQTAKPLSFIERIKLKKQQQQQQTKIEEEQTPAENKVVPISELPDAMF